MAVGGGVGKRGPGKRTLETRQMLDDLGCNPVLALAIIGMDKSNPIEVRVSALKEVAKYHSPQLRSTETQIEQAPQKMEIVWAGNKIATQETKDDEAPE